ncbi:hypothetical protein CAAN1_01S03774 [[Candida] anglica]|uniref:Uncharacterized protein n=1 Tax=[Candida] anglica TaxID=148631 RepID=A0ABP0EJG1_9ASCO
MTNPPATPPRTRPSTRSTQFSPPVFHTTFRTPKTPKHGDCPFTTPISTQKGGVLMNPMMKTPHRTGKIGSMNTTSEQGLGVDSVRRTLFPMSPEITPLRSPNRSVRKKRVFVDDITTDLPMQKLSKTDPMLPALKECAFGLLLPAQSTVGSGRRATHIQQPSKTQQQPPLLETSFFADIAHEEDLDIDDSFSSPIPVTPQLNETSSSNFLKTNNMNFMKPIEYDHIENSPTSKKKSTSFIPQTPVAQLIDDETIFRWHGKSFNSGISSDEEESGTLEDNIELKEIHNPFLSPKRNSLQSTPIKRGTIDYSTHMELVNNKTGERKIVELSPEQATIKPKKLDFFSLM